MGQLTCRFSRILTLECFLRRVYKTTRKDLRLSMQSNFPNNKTCISLRKNVKTLSKNKQKIQAYKFKQKFGTCYTCGSFEHKNAQCPVRKILKNLKSSKNESYGNMPKEEVYGIYGSQFHSMMLQDQPLNGQIAPGSLRTEEN